MSRSGGRETVGVKLRPSTVQVLDMLASEHSVSRSDVLRAALRVALAHPEELDAELEREREL